MSDRGKEIGFPMRILGEVSHCITVCRIEAARCFLDTVNRECTLRTNCPLAAVRGELEDKSPAFYLLLREGVDYHRIIDNLVRAERKGDIEQWRTAADLLWFVHSLALYIKTLYYLEGDYTPNISPDFIILKQSEGEPDLDEVQEKLQKNTSYAFPQELDNFQDEEYLKKVLRLLYIYVSALERDRELAIVPLTEKERDELLEGVERYLAAKRDRGIEDSGVH